MSYTLRSLAKAGLTNRDAPDLRDLTGPEHVKLCATFCGSDQCCRDDHANFRGLVVSVSEKFLDTCPDCGSGAMLFFEKVDQKSAERLLAAIEKRKKTKWQIRKPIEGQRK